MDRFSAEIELRKLVAQITVLIRRRTGIRIDRIRVFRLYGVGFFGSFVFGGGLPGRFCPDSCAEKIKEEIENYFEKRGETIE